MGNFKFFFVFLSACVLLAATLSPWIYLGVQWSADFWKWSWLEYLAKHPFHRYFHRVLQVGILVGIWPLLKRSGIHSLKDIGLEGRGFFRIFWVGFGSSLIFMGVYSGILWKAGLIAGVGSPVFGDLILKFFKIMATCLIVGILEEVFFRGYFYKLSRQSMGVRTAVGMNMVFFACVHYLKSGGTGFEVVDGSSGFQMMGVSLQRFLMPMDIMGGICVLMTVAWILCWTVEWTGNLGLAIGLHAGWVFVLQWISELTHDSAGVPAWLLGGGSLRDGVLTLVPLILQFLVLRWLLEKRKMEG